MRRIAYYPLHYGAEYLAWSVRSIQDAVDEVHVLYTSRPSYGHGTDLPCPDTEELLRAEASRFAAIPVTWHRGDWLSEGQHRSAVMTIAVGRGASQVLAVDADEVWVPGGARAALRHMELHPAARLNVPFVHFWRGFRHTCRDHWLPTRVLNPHLRDGTSDYPVELGPLVLHFGYAQTARTVEYKWSCHGHKPELRAGWLDTYRKWAPGVNDVHPTTRDIWNPRPTTGDEERLLDQVLGDHPYRHLETVS